MILTASTTAELESVVSSENSCAVTASLSKLSEESESALAEENEENDVRHRCAVE